MDDLKVIIVLLVIVGLAVVYVVRAKRRGVKCIGCSASCSCKGVEAVGGSCRGCCSGEDFGDSIGKRLGKSQKND